MLRGSGAQRLLAVADLKDLESSMAKEIAKDPPIVRLILDYKNALCHAFSTAVGFMVVDNRNARSIVHDLARDRNSSCVFTNFGEQCLRAEIGPRPRRRIWRSGYPCASSGDPGR